MKKTSALTFAALMCAVSAAVIYLSAVFGTMRLAAMFAASLTLMLTVKVGSVKLAYAQYAAVSLLLLLIVPQKTVALAYILFPGLYSVLKWHIEQIGKMRLEWLIKIAVFIVITAAFALLFRIFVSSAVSFPLYAVIAAFALMPVVMAVYDLFLSVCAGVMFKYLSKYIKQ